jgi:hypothetical protein
MNIGSVDPNFTGVELLQDLEMQPTILNDLVTFWQAGVLLL